MKYIASLILIGCPLLALATEPSPYMGEELRSIKSLSVHEVQSLLRGDGMGLAKAAELNHFPGPKHVLEVADELELSPSQRAETEALFDEMRRNAKALGEKLVLAESRLDREFETGSVNAKSLDTALSEIGKLRARLRFIHLEAHLQQKRILSPHQVKKYDTVRGYDRSSHDHRKHSNSRE